MKETASGSAPAALSSLGAADDSARCDRCGEAFRRRTNEPTCPDCAAPLRRHRKTAGLTQVELAERVGCRPATISDLERKPFHLALELAESIARELGTDVLDVFPALEVTKVETQKVLHKTSRSIIELCESGELPCNSDGHWHRIPLRAVLELRDRLDEFERDWFSFTAAAERSGLPRWVVHRLHVAGEFGDDVKVLDKSTRPRYFVRRSRFDEVYARLVRDYRGVRCPRCKLPVKLGRKAHARCLGWLGAHSYWVPDDPNLRWQRRQRHSELVRATLHRTERPIADLTRWFEARWQREPSRELKARWWGRKGGRPSMATLDPEFVHKAERARQLASAHPEWGTRTIADEVGLSRWKVRELLSALRAS
jgi:DNA-binding XRE family transcriptional regulator